MKNPILILSLLAFAFTACSKDDDDNNDDPQTDKIAPVIVITMPQPDSVKMYHSGETMPIQAAITENDELHEVEVEVYNVSANQEVFHMHMHEHSQSLTIDTSVVIPTGIMHTDFELKIKASDHSGNEAVASITKHVHM